jgi:general secretion pathway protein D
MWLAVLPSLLAMVGAHVAQSQDATTVRIETPRDDPKPGGEAFGVTVMVDDVTNLGAFQFQLTYDPGIVEFLDVKEGLFLGSSGRPVECLPPQESEGSVDFTCVTLGSAPEGPTGSGELATVTFRPVASGTSPLHFELLILADPPANRLPALAEDASITVQETQDGGFRWALWGPVIGGVAVALAAAGAFAQWFRRRPR